VKRSSLDREVKSVIDGKGRSQDSKQWKDVGVHFVVQKPYERLGAAERAWMEVRAKRATAILGKWGANKRLGSRTKRKFTAKNVRAKVV
jgi:hypothetical protein